jgi:arginine-tRNA-protein transferase
MLEVFQEHPCPYLPDLEARMRYRLIEQCSVDDYATMLERGWRRFGCTFFRPVCVGCDECKSLRLDPGKFSPSRSQKRTWKRNLDLDVLLRPTSLTAEHLELYERYHADMTDRRGWEDKGLSSLHYYQTFVEGRHEWGHELAYYEGDRLLCIALVDLLPNALSAVYCYYDPEERRRGLGVFSILVQLDLARRRGLDHVYLGYWVRPNPSMRYKSAYRPFEILQGRPPLDEPSEWQEHEDAPESTPSTESAPQPRRSTA